MEDIIKGQWQQIKGEAQKQWGKLTGDDLDVISGQRSKLVGRLQEIYGWSKEKAQQEVDSWSGKFK